MLFADSSRCEFLFYTIILFSLILITSYSFVCKSLRIIVICAVLLFTATARADVPDTRRFSVVVDFQVTQMAEELRLGIDAMIRDDLKALSQVDVVEDNDLELLLRSLHADNYKKTLQRAGIDFLLKAHCKPSKEGFVVTASLERLSDGSSVELAGQTMLQRNLGQAPFIIIRGLFLRASEKKMIPSIVVTAADQSRLNMAVRPQYDTLLAYGKARQIEYEKPADALALLRKALTIDPDFHQAYARLFYAYYANYPTYQQAESDVWSQTLVRKDSLGAVWLARAFYDLAIRLRNAGHLPTALAYHRISNTLLKSAGYSQSLLATLNLHRSGEIQIATAQPYQAYYSFQTVREALESAQNKQLFFYSSNLLPLSAAYSSDNKPEIAIRLLDIAGHTSDQPTLFHALVKANTGLVHSKAGDQAAFKDFQSARSILLNRDFGLSSMYLGLLVQEANLLRSIGEIRSAETMYSEVLLRCRILGMNGSRAQADAFSGLGMTRMAKGESQVARHYLQNASFMQLRLGPRPTFEMFTITQLPEKKATGLTQEEENRMASFTGKFRYESHSKYVQARTYAGRLDDTNVILHDLFDKTRTENNALNILRGLLVGKSTDKKVVFIDIGPAVANPVSPAVTAVSLARDFPEMTVVALDLPEQVNRFAKEVAPNLKQRVLDFENLHILSANGVAPLKRQMNERNWFDPKWSKSVQISSANAIVIRAANSIDIYQPWPAIESHLLSLASDFEANPILYLFNRSILFKKAGSKEFHIIGVLSPAGFDHMYETFNRVGESAYTLLPIEEAK